MDEWHSYPLKRPFDVCLALMLLLAASPILALCAFLVWYEDRFDVLDRQKVMGMGGKTFEMLTFRTLQPGVHRLFKGEQIREDDAGTTNVGQFLLNSRLERLPVLINIIRGEMSFVGPLPDRIEAATALDRKVPRYSQRYRARPGLVSLADVYGERNHSVPARLRYDLFYIERQSLMWDLRLLRAELRRRLRGSSGVGGDAFLKP